MTTDGFMTAAEIALSVRRGNAMALELRKTAHQTETFRFPQSVLMLAIGHKRNNVRANFKNAMHAAMDWSANPYLTEADAYQFVNKIIREHKREIIEARDL